MPTSCHHNSARPRRRTCQLRIMSKPRTARSERAKSPEAGKHQRKTKRVEKRDEQLDRPDGDQKTNPEEFATDRRRGNGQRNPTESQAKPAASRSDEIPALKRANGPQRGKRHKAPSSSDRDDPPRTSESRSTGQRPRAHKSGSTEPSGETQGSNQTLETPRKDPQERTQQVKSRQCGSQGEAQKIAKGNQVDPAPNNDRESKSHKTREVPEPGFRRSAEVPPKIPSGTTESLGQHASEEQDKVLHATIEKLKIKKRERSAASNRVNTVTEKVVSHLKRNVSWCAGTECLTTGSYYENVKICEPDEFDVMLTVPVERVDIQNFPGKEAFYSVALKRHPGKHYLARFLNEDRTIKASEMLNEFRDGVKKAVEKMFEDVKTVDLPSYKIVIQRKKQKCPAVTLQVTENGKEIFIDFVLGLKVRGRWPDNTQNGFKIEQWLGAKKKQELKCQPYYLVPKYEGKGNEEHDGVDAKNGWRISFSHVEKYILTNHGNSKTCCEAKREKCCRKECLKLLKYLLSQLKEKHSEKMSKFCSYHAKTTLLHACYQRPVDSMWAYRQLTDCFRQLLEDFITSLKAQNLPNFFVPSHNLLNTDSVPKSSCNFLAAEIEFQWKENFPIFQ